MKFKFLNIVVILLLCNIEMSFSGEGGYAGSFLRIGLGARPKAMGGAYTAVCDDSYAAYYNPAGLALLENRYVTTSIMMLSLNRSFNYIGFSQGIKPAGGVSFGLIHAGVGGIEERNFAGEKTGSIQYSENAFMFSFAQKINRYLAVGITGKILYHKLYELTAKGFGVDAGVLVIPLKNLKVGFTVKDLNSRYSWNSNDIYERGSLTEDEFPGVMRGGASYTLDKYDVVFACDIEKIQHIGSRAHIGIEKKWQKKYAVRAGINNKNLCFGGGASFPVFGKTGIVDYCFENVEFDESPSQIITLNILF